VASLVVLAAVTAAIVVVIRDKHGNQIAVVNVPEGGSVETKDDKKPSTQEKVRIEPEALPPIKPGDPLSGLALVQKPAKLPGVRSWSIATRESGTTSDLAYSPDGTRLAVGTWDGLVRIWEAKTGRLLRVFYSHGTVIKLAWSPDGRVLALGTGAYSRPVHLWDTETGRLLRRLETPKVEFILALAWSPDGRKLRAWGTGQRSCYTWNAATGKLLSAPAVPCPIERPPFSPDGLRLAGVVDDKHIVIWNTDTGQEISHMTAHAAVGRFSWSPDGKLLACTGKDGLGIWDVEKRKEIKHWSKAVQMENAPAWSPDGRRLLFIEKEHLDTVVIEVNGDAEPMRLENGNGVFVWSADGKTIAGINGEPWIILFDAKTGKRIRTLTNGAAPFGFALSPDDRTFALSERLGSLLASADTGQVIAEMKQETWPKTLTAWPLAWSPDGKLLAAQGPDNAVQLWHADGKKHLALTEHTDDVTSLSWSPNGKRLASTAAAEKRVLIWDAIKGERESELGPFDGVAENVKWSRDGRFVTFNVAEIGWHVWDIEGKKLVNDPKQWKVWWFELTPDGRSALVAPTGKEVFRLRDLVGGKEGMRLPSGHNIYQADPMWSPDGKFLAVSTGYGIEWWRGDVSKRLRAMQFEGGASHIVISHDSKRILAMSGNRLQVWETDTGRLLGVRMIGKRFNALTMTPDGHYTGNENVERGIVMVVEKDDGTQEMLEPADFAKKYRWKNEPDKVRLTEK
jgi:WD40 repeat protein